jgi:hypothetical protein
MEDRRSTFRHRTYKGAKIVSRSTPRGIIECIVRNLSEVGACILVDRPDTLPSSFHLVFNGPEPDQRCCIVWRGDNRIGAMFE